MLYYLMSTNKFISYLLCNKGIIVNLYKLHFLSSHFFFLIKQKSFLSSNFSILPKFSIFPLFHSSNQTDPKKTLARHDVNEELLLQQ